MIMFSEVREVVSTALQLADGADEFQESSQLLGCLPELDSMAVVVVITALEDHFDCAFDDSEISAEIFETWGSLAQFVTDQVAGSS